jgi:hypothetical protein
MDINNMTKYHNRKTTIDNIKFDSNAEAVMYQDLSMMQRCREISDLKLQVPFVLVEGYKDLKGKKVRDIVYIADFTFYDEDQKRFRVLDCKGVRTAVFILKEKIFNKIMKDQGVTLEYNI